MLPPNKAIIWTESWEGILIIAGMPHQSFQDLSCAGAAGFEPRSSRSEDPHTSDWANQAAPWAAPCPLHT